MSAAPIGATIDAAWYLKSEGNEPLGQVYRDLNEVAPVLGAPLRDGERWGALEIVSFEELASTCEMRRFRVVVRHLS